jgi:hypothetical protein
MSGDPYFYGDDRPVDVYWSATPVGHVTSMVPNPNGRRVPRRMWRPEPPAGLGQRPRCPPTPRYGSTFAAPAALNPGRRENMRVMVNVPSVVLAQVTT